MQGGSGDWNSLIRSPPLAEIMRNEDEHNQPSPQDPHSCQGTLDKAPLSPHLLSKRAES